MGGEDELHGRIVELENLCTELAAELNGRVRPEEGPCGANNVLVAFESYRKRILREGR